MANWIKGAIKHPGALRARAKKAGALKGGGSIPESYLKTAQHSGNPTTRKQANLAETLKHLHH